MIRRENERTQVDIDLPEGRQQGMELFCWRTAERNDLRIGVLPRLSQHTRNAVITLAKYSLDVLTPFPEYKAGNQINNIVML